VTRPGSTLDAIETLAFALVSLTSRAIADRGAHLLTFQQWRALVVLGRATEPLRISDLARRIAASGPSTSRIARRLAAHELVALEPDRRDRRAVRVRLTARGEEVRGAVVARRRELIREMIGPRADRPLSADGAEMVAALEAAI
jgi:DNA-binding MarR family transcriptional regulator